MSDLLGIPLKRFYKYADVHIVNFNKEKIPKDGFYCEGMRCSECVLDKECQVNVIDTYLSDNDLNYIKENNPEYFI